MSRSAEDWEDFYNVPLNGKKSIRMTTELKSAFEEMKRTDMALDDMDYLECSAAYQKAMSAAKRFYELLDEAERKRNGGRVQ